jgi:hypothetical protein
MPKAAGFDTDAQAFITAAAITNPTQQNAINTLVLALKGYSIWTKFKAIYPIVGGTASQHKFNLKDPRDLDVAFRLQFAVGWTHSANGMTPLVTYANTFLKSNSILTQNSTHISYYSRTNSNGSEVEMGGLSGGAQLLLEIRTSNITYFVVNQNGGYPTYSDSDSRAFYIGNRTASNVVNGWKNGIKVANNTSASSSPPNFNLYLGAYNNGAGFGLSPTTKQCAFASIGDGLTDTDAANFYTAVQAYQTTLGRSIGTQTVSDADAQAFVTAANITDQVEANAVNNLVIGMKADGIWTKMKAIYPVVGGNASSHAVNLKTPGTYNLSFAVGWTHSATGMLPNGATYANTALNPSSALTLNSTHLSFYSRTNVSAVQRDIAIYQVGDNPTMALGTSVGAEISDHYNYGQRISASIAASTGFYLGTRTTSTIHKLYKNNTTLGTNTSANVNILPNGNIFIGAANSTTLGITSYSTKECAFASIGDGLTDTEATNYYNRVQTYQTVLNRNV